MLVGVCSTTDCFAGDVHTHMRRYLDVCYNQIARLPPQFGHLVGLERLLLSDNKLEAVPEEVSWAHVPVTAVACAPSRWRGCGRG